MYKYEYEKVFCKLGGWKALSGNEYNLEKHRKIIEERTKNGWRYVGFIPTKQRGTGHIQEMDLIFEKKIK